VLVLATLVTAFVVVGPPRFQRSLAFDRQRVTDLSAIQSQIRSYWSQTDHLPAMLGDLSSAISGFSVPKDPQTGADYEYALTGDNSFQLCANFDLASEKNAVSTPSGFYPDPSSQENWQHGAGRVCFSRTLNAPIDKIPQPVY
jgi:hypothetical protein